MMKNNLTIEHAIALVRYFPDKNSLAKALDLCQGLQGVSSKTQIPIKPDLVFRDEGLALPLHGVSTTPRRVEALSEEI